jgi:dTDP-4-dehydrorhamnose reductase
MGALSHRILLTGGTGRLGQELTRLLPGLIAPPHRELDIVQPHTIQAALDRYAPTVLVHAAAYTDVAGAERDQDTCWGINVVGTRHLVGAAREHGLRLVHISTDYVFYGNRGLYKEDDPVGPVRNYYALSKLVAEEIVRCAPRHLNQTSRHWYTGSTHKHTAPTYSVRDVYESHVD